VLDLSTDACPNYQRVPATNLSGDVEIDADEGAEVEEKEEEGGRNEPRDELKS
jgi:hypothetical protein